MKLSEKIQEALREQLEICLSAARRYLPDYDEHPEIQTADAAIAKTTGEQS